MQIVKFIQRWIAVLLFVAIATLIVTPKIEAHFSSPRSIPIERGVIPASLFGMHIHHADKTWPNISFHSWRLWDAFVTWGDLEPEAGVWKFELLDRSVELAMKEKVELLMTLGQTPRWASARPNDESPYGNPGWPAEPANIQNWRNYVRTVATRYRGKIHYYEIWNEPDYKMFYTGSIDKMLELAREAYTILKQVDPTIVVVSPGASNGTPNLQWQKTYFSKGGGKYADAIGQHFYHQTTTSKPEDLAKYIQQFNAVMAEFDLQQKQLWNTEAGWMKPSTFKSDRLAMAYVARAYLINWMSGVKRFFWYSWDNQNNVSIHFTQSDAKTPSSISKSYTQVYKWMVGAQMQTCKVNADRTWICQLSRKGKPAWIVWNPDRNLTFTVPKNWQVKNTQDLNGKNTKLPNSRKISIDFSPLLLGTTTLPELAISSSHILF